MAIHLNDDDDEQILGRARKHGEHGGVNRCRSYRKQDVRRVEDPHRATGYPGCARMAREDQVSVHRDRAANGRRYTIEAAEAHEALGKRALVGPPAYRRTLFVGVAAVASVAVDGVH